MFAVIFGFFAFLLYLITIPIRKKLKNKGNLLEKTDKKIKWIFVAATLFISFYNAFDALFPSDAFYFREFTRVTGRKIPKSATVLGKASSFPGFLGDYASCSIIQLNEKDYDALYDSIINDTTMAKGELRGGSDEMSKASKNKIDIYHSVRQGFIRQTAKEIHHYYYIGFIEGETKIVVFISVV